MNSSAFHPLKLRLLLVGGDAYLRDAAAVAASTLGAALELAPDLDSAIRRLLNPDAGFSHVLAPDTLEPAETDCLAGMVDEVIALPTRLLILGAAEDRGPTEIAVPDPDAAAIAAAVRGNKAAPTPQAATLSGDDLRAALHAGQLRMRFQPVVDVNSFRPLALEALARLHHPLLGILRPLEFMPSAFASGQERALTGIAAARTLLELRPLPRLDGLYFAINTPMTTLLHVYAAERAAELCAVAGIPCRRVVIEALETMVAPDMRELASALERWRRAGFNITIDDAGPRLPHWQRLLDLPFNGVKLDGCLAGGSNEATDFAARITDQARARKMYVVAEGIERETDAIRMRGLGVSALQGFFFSRPLPARAVPIWLESAKLATLP